MKKLFTLSTFFFITLAVQAQWLQQNTGFTSVSRGIRDISIVSPTVAWAVAYDGSGANANVQDYTRTTNGGTNWSAGTISATGITGFNNANISALDGNTAWVALYGAAGGGRIYHTTNGGTSWTQQNTTGYTSASSFLNAVHFFDALNGVSLGDPAGGWHEVYTTQNGGLTWTRVPQANMPALLAADEYGVIDMFSTVGDTIWFGTVYGRVFKSTNKGLNWTANTTGFTGNATTYAMDDIEFLNGNDGLVKNGGVIRRTTDGGLTWSAVPASGTIFTTDMGPVPGTPESYVSVGTTGSSYTQNAGNNWTTINNVQYNKVAFINPTTGWAGGFSQAGGTGGIFKWNGPTLLPTADLSISAINSPATTLCNASAALVCVVITNTGTITQSNFPISYTINSGTPVTVNYTGTILPGANASYCFSPPASFPAPGTYTVVASVQLAADMNPANNSTTKTVTSVAPAPVTITGGGLVCAGQPATLSASGANTYTWQPGALTGSAITISPTTNTTYTVTGNAGTGCNGTATATVTVSAGPTIATSVTPATICVGQSAVISASGAVSYSWNASGATTNTQTVSPNSTTTYVVTGTDANGCTATGNAVVTVSNGPSLAVLATPGSVCPGEAVALSASGGVTYSWHIAGQTTNTLNVNPTTTTTYSVTGTDAAGCTGSASAMVIVTSAPVISVSSPQATICTGQSAELSATGGVSYSWHHNGQTTGNISVSPAASTTYSVTAQTSSGCTGESAITVTVNAAPVISVTTPQSTLCAGESTTLSASGANLSYSWAPNAGPGVPGSVLTVTPQATTTYTVYGTNAQGCTGQATQTITVNTAPVVTLTTSQTTICEGQSATLTGSGAQFSYSWTSSSGGMGLPTSGSIITATPQSTTTYTLYGTDANQGCPGIATITIQVTPAPVAPAITGNGALCAGDTLQLCITTAYPTGVIYSWTAPNNFSSSLECINIAGVSAADQGLFQTWVSVNGCQSQPSLTQVTINPAPDATILPPVITGNSFAFSAATSGLPGYSWSFPGGTPATANTASTTTTYPGAGSYMAILTTTSGAGCTASDTLSFTISGANSYLQNLVKLYPNPTTGLVLLDLSGLAIEKATLQVYNTLGQLARTKVVNAAEVCGLNLTDLPEGAYTIRVMTSAGVLNKQVLLQK